MTEDTLTLRFAAARGGDEGATPGDARPTAASLGQFCRQLDIAYRLLWSASTEPPTDVDSTEFASAMAAGGVSMTPAADLPVPLRVRRVTSDFGLSLTLAGDATATHGAVRLCGWTPAAQPVEEGVTLDSLEAAQASLAAGIDTLRDGLETTESA